MEKDALTRLIKKYEAGKCTPAEIQQLEAWWNAALDSDHYKNEVSQVERGLLKQQTLTALQYSIRQERQKDNVIQLVLWERMSLRAVAACAAILIIAAFVTVKWYGSDEVLIASKFGEKIEVTLPDGSTAILNGNSILRYSKWKPDEERTVWLEGEAYFSVQHTKNHNRFIVNSPDSLRVEVLGTKFTVNNHTGETNVVLREGKVRLEKSSHTFVMKPNEMASYSRSSKTFVKHTVNAIQAVSWKDNLLIFRDETLQSIANRLKSSHGINIIFKNRAHADELFNGSIPGDSVELLFEKIESLYDMKVTRDDDDNYIIE
jgi:ferric-dicitrate binding protein FerR (iron transport regulator)